MHWHTLHHVLGRKSFTVHAQSKIYAYTCIFYLFPSNNSMNKILWHEKVLRLSTGTTTLGFVTHLSIQTVLRRWQIHARDPEPSTEVRISGEQQECCRVFGQSYESRRHFNLRKRHSNRSWTYRDMFNSWIFRRRRQCSGKGAAVRRIISQRFNILRMTHRISSQLLVVLCRKRCGELLYW